MTDSADHDRQTVAFPVSDLTRRLLRRATEPIGAIDVRHAVELHSRSSLWSAQRSELLEGLKRRYGLGQSGGAAGHALPVAGGPFTATLQRTAAARPFDLAAVPSSAGRARIAETATGAISEQPPASSARHYRVKRPNRHAEPNPLGPLSSETVTTRSPAAGGIHGRPNSIAATQLLRKTADTQSPAGSGPEASPLSLVRAADTRPVDEPAPRDDGPPAAIPNAGELPRAVAALMPLRRMPDGSTEIGHSIMRDDLVGGDAAPLSSPSPIGLPLAGGEIRLSTDSIAATQLQRTTGDTQSLAGSGPAASALPLVRAADTRPVDQPAPRDGGPPAAAVPQVGELSRAAVAAPMPLQRMPVGSAEIDHSNLRDDLAGGDASSLSSPWSIGVQPAGGEIRLGTGSIATTQLQPATGDTQSLAGSGPEAAALPLMRAAAADNPRRVGNEPAPANDGSPGAGAVPQVSELPRGAAVAQLLLQRMPDGAAAMSRSTTPDFWPNGDAFPLSGPSSARPHPQRKADDPAASPAESPMRTVGTAGAPPHINAHAQFRGAVSAEIRAAPLLPGSASIVWRKADANGASRESAATARTTGPIYTNGARILREAAAETASSPGVTPAATPSSESSGVDVFLIAEQVSRIISRQLRVERERRGRRR
jgi:hypothetical protein